MLLQFFLITLSVLLNKTCLLYDNLSFSGITCKDCKTFCSIAKVMANPISRSSSANQCVKSFLGVFKLVKCHKAISREYLHEICPWNLSQNYRSNTQICIYYWAHHKYGQFTISRSIGNYVFVLSLFTYMAHVFQLGFKMVIPLVLS